MSIFRMVFVLFLFYILCPIMMNLLSAQEARLQMEFIEGKNLLGVTMSSDDQQVLLAKDIKKLNFLLTNVEGSLSQPFVELEPYKRSINDICIGDADNDNTNELLAITDHDLLVFENVDKQYTLDTKKRINLYPNGSGFGKTSIHNIAEQSKPARPLLLKEQDKRGIRVLVDDINNDGKNEVITVKHAGGFERFSFVELDVFAWNDNGFTAIINLLHPGTGKQGIQIIDLDLDGKKEMVFAVSGGLGIFQYSMEYEDFVRKAAPIELAPAIEDQRLDVGLFGGELVLVHCILAQGKDEEFENEVGIVKKYILKPELFLQMRDVNYLPPLKFDYKVFRREWRRIALPSELFSNYQTLMRLPTEVDVNGIKRVTIDNILIKDVNNDKQNEIAVNVPKGVFVFYMSK